MKLLLGHWLGHPLHPALVHVPIALWIGALFFDVLSLANVGHNALVRTSYWAILLGLLSTLIVVPAGFAEWTQIKREKPAWKLALWHMILNVAVTLLFLGSFYLRAGAAASAERVPLSAFWLCLVANIILMVSGYIGGRLVYEHGIGVARFSRKKWRAIAAAGHANLPPEL
jgi:uncharacterized membrane protein